MTERIVFGIKGPEGVYRGEILGDRLAPDVVYDVKMADGDSFPLVAVVSPDSKEYKWRGSKSKFAKLIPILGNIISRYFQRLESQRPVIT